jgi:hypothetical protein
MLKITNGVKMAISGTGTFENDGAADFLNRLLDGNKLKPVYEALDSVLQADDYLDVDYGEEAIAAAEVVALLKGKPAKDLQHRLIEWHEKHAFSVDEGLVAKAVEAVEKAYSDPEVSEIRALMEEGDDEEWFSLWSANIEGLLARLKS